MYVLVVLCELIDIGTHLQIHIDGTLPGVDASLEHPHLVQCPHVYSFLLGQVTLDTFLTGCLFWQNPDLIFLYHYCIID